MRGKAFALCALVIAAGAFAGAYAAISDTVDVKFDRVDDPEQAGVPARSRRSRRTARSGTPASAPTSIGRFDPATQQFKEFALPTPNSGPHGLQADKDGNIWYTGNAAGLIGKVDPKTGKVTEYKMPNPKARDPHTIAFLRDGRIFFTVQAGNFIGTLDPKAPTAHQAGRIADA